MATRMPRQEHKSRGLLSSGVLAVLWLANASASAAQSPPPRPKPPEEKQTEQTPPRRPPKPVEPRTPPPELLVSADMACRLELDGEPIGELQKDVVERFTIKPGDHLLQAFPLEVEGPTWKEPIKAPDTGIVAQTIELAELVEEWRESQKDRDRFEVRDRIVLDHQTGLMWARNAGPEMSWEQVQRYCVGRDTDGFRGWRLPVLDELSTLQFEDHESPRQEMTGGETKWTILGRRQTDTEVLPRLIYPAFDHNAVGALWIKSDLDSTACSFLGGFSCEVLRRKKDRAAVLCVRPFTEQELSAGQVAAGDAERAGGEEVDAPMATDEDSG